MKVTTFDLSKTYEVNAINYDISYCAVADFYMSSQSICKLEYEGLDDKQVFNTYVAIRKWVKNVGIPVEVVKNKNSVLLFK